MSQDSKSSRLLDVEIAEIGTFTGLIKKLSTMIVDARFIFSQTDSTNKNKGGLVFKQSSEDGQSFIDLRIGASKFQKFLCNKDYVDIGVDMKNFHTSLNMIGDKVAVRFYILKNTPEVLHIRSLEDYPVKIDFFLQTVTETKVPNMLTEGRPCFQVERGRFYTICKEYLAVANGISLTVNDDQMLFNIKSKEIGEICRCIPLLDASNNKKGKVINGNFEVGKVLSFFDYLKRDDNLKVIIDNDFPLVLTFAIPSLGVVVIACTPLDTGRDD